VKTFAVAAASLAILAAPAAGQDAKPLTVEQCIGVLNGLNSLNWAGQQLNEPNDKKPADAKQYKLGDARFTISMDISSLDPVRAAFQRSQQGFLAEQPVLPAVDKDGKTADGKMATPELQQAIADQNKAFQAHQIADLAKPCPVAPGRLKLQELKIGDNPDQNAIPPSVLAAFSPIVDK
jgi:hypothetical protein